MLDISFSCKIITFCVKIIIFFVKQHFASKVITFCVTLTFCARSYYIFRYYYILCELLHFGARPRNTAGSWFFSLVEIKILSHSVLCKLELAFDHLAQTDIQTSLSFYKIFILNRRYWVYFYFLKFLHVWINFQARWNKNRAFFVYMHLFYLNFHKPLYF